MLAKPAAVYRRLLKKRRLVLEIAEKPQVYLAPAEAWTDVTIRYLVAAGERRKWASRLYETLATEFNQPEHAKRIIRAYPVRRVYLHETS